MENKKENLYIRESYTHIFFLKLKSYILSSSLSDKIHYYNLLINYIQQLLYIEVVGAH